MSLRSMLKNIQSEHIEYDSIENRFIEQNIERFKKAQELEAIKKKPMNEIIQAIHNEFDSAHLSILQEAEKFRISDVKISKAERLKKLGFGKSKTVKENAEYQKKKVEADLVLYYQQHYPGNKFIRAEQVGLICKKYGLCYSWVNEYIGDVPEKNLAEIEAFELRKEDCEKIACGWWDFGNGVYSGLRSVANKTKTSVWGYNKSWGNSFEPAPEDAKFAYEKPPLQIVAPPNEFSQEIGSYVREDGKLIQDPIVLQPVKGGWLIVTKWGLEASDELVVNQKMN